MDESTLAVKGFEEAGELQSWSVQQSASPIDIGGSASANTVTIDVSEEGNDPEFMLLEEYELVEPKLGITRGRIQSVSTELGTSSLSGDTPFTKLNAKRFALPQANLFDSFQGAVFVPKSVNSLGYDAGFDVDDAGNLYTAGLGAGGNGWGVQFTKFSPTGTILRQFSYSETTIYERPFELRVSPNGLFLFFRLGPKLLLANVATGAVRTMFTQLYQADQQVSQIAVTNTNLFAATLNTSNGTVEVRRFSWNASTQAYIDSAFLFGGTPMSYISGFDIYGPNNNYVVTAVTAGDAAYIGRRWYTTYMPEEGTTPIVEYKTSTVLQPALKAGTSRGVGVTTLPSGDFYTVMTPPEGIDYYSMPIVSSIRHFSPDSELLNTFAVSTGERNDPASSAIGLRLSATADQLYGWGGDRNFGIYPIYQVSSYKAIRWATISTLNPTLAQAFRYYVSLIDPQLNVIFEASANPTLPLVGWDDSVWTKLNQLAAAYNVELAYDQTGNIVIRDLGTRVLSVEDAQRSSTEISMEGSARAVDVEYTQARSGTGVLYDAREDDNRVLEVDVQERKIEILNSTNYALTVNQPVRVVSVNPADGQYVISAADGLPVALEQFEDYGGSLRVGISNSIPGALELTLTGPSRAIPGVEGPFKLAVSDGSNTYATLKITGTGVFTKPRIARIFGGADPEVTTTEVLGSPTQNPFISTRGQAFDRGDWSAQMAAAPRVTRTYDISYEDSLGFGLTAGAVIEDRDAKGRIVTASFSFGRISLTTEWYTTAGDWEALWAGKTAGDYEVNWAGYTAKHSHIKPLRKVV